MVEEKGYWDRVNSYGDMLYKRAIGELDEMESSKALCNVLKDFYRPNMNVLDAGCAAGHYLRSFRERLDNEINYTGVDVTKYYLELARKAFPGVDFHHGNVCELPFGDEQFDMVLNNNLVMHLAPPPTAAISELMRVAKEYVVIRTIVGERNYIIKEIRDNSEVEDGSDNVLDIIVNDKEITEFNFLNIYTEDYLNKLIHLIHPNVSVSFIEDTDWREFDNRSVTTGTGTRVVAGKQVSGNIIFDWRFIVIKKN